ncbi:DUF4870 domain-containing protein [bacterium]|nr:DUF4870 domain-containing protein [bacterium]
MSSFDPSQYPNQSPGADSSTGAGAAPGWYPIDQLSQRYWDGYEWTNHVAPLGPGGGVAQSGGITTNEQRTYALFMHLGSLFVGFLVPLIMWLIKREESPFIDDHGKQLMNWNISLVIYFVASVLLVLVVIGILLIPILILLHLIFSIMGAVASNRGDLYRYPIAIPFFS